MTLSGCWYHREILQRWLSPGETFWCFERNALWTLSFSSLGVVPFWFKRRRKTYNSFLMINWGSDWFCCLRKWLSSGMIKNDRTVWRGSLVWKSDVKVWRWSLESLMWKPAWYGNLKSNKIKEVCDSSTVWDIMSLLVLKVTGANQVLLFNKFSNRNHLIQLIVPREARTRSSWMARRNEN